MAIFKPDEVASLFERLNTIGSYRSNQSH